MNSQVNSSAVMKESKQPFRFQMMKEQPNKLERFDLQFSWGEYGIRVLRWHLTTFPAGKIIGFHKHSEYEFHFIPRGKGKVVIEDQEYPLQAGMFYLTGPNVMHYQEADALQTMDELCLHIDIVPLNPTKKAADNDKWGQLWEINESEECIKQLNSLPTVPVMDQFDAMQCFLSAYRAIDDNHLGLFTFLKQSIQQILLRSVQAYAVQPFQTILPSRDMNRYRYEMAVQFIQDNYDGPLKLSDVAEKIHVSERQLQRIFNEQASLTFSEYLEQFRLSKVCSWLVKSNLSVEEIAVESGFSSSRYLHYVFKNRFSMTPKMYRDQLRKQNINS